MKKFYCIFTLLVCVSSYAGTSVGLSKNTYAYNNHNYYDKELDALKDKVNKNKWINVDNLTNGQSLYVIEQGSKSYAYNYLARRSLEKDNSVTFGFGVQMDALGVWGQQIENSNSYFYNTSNSYYKNNNVQFSFSDIMIPIVANAGNIFQIELSPVYDGTSNSFYVRNALFTIGNLDEFPAYFTIGRSRIDQSSFWGNAPWSNTLYNQLYRTGFVNQIQLGIAPKFLGGQLLSETTAYNSSINSSQRFNVAEYLDWDQEFKNSFNYNIMAGVIGDLRGTDSGVSNSLENGIRSIETQQKFANQRMSMASIGASIGYQSVSLYGILNSSFDKVEITNNNLAHGWLAGANYQHNIFSFPTTFSISYTKQYNTQNLSISLPGNQLNGASFTGMESGILAWVQTALLKNLYLDLEANSLKTYEDKYTTMVGIDLEYFI